MKDKHNPNLTPKIEPGRATFTWRGKKPPQVIGDFNDWEPERALVMRRDESDQWCVTIELPNDAYIEYAFLLDGERVEDPNNPRLAENGSGSYNHFFYMPEGGPTPLARRRRGCRKGELSRHVLQGKYYLGSGLRTIDLYEREVWLYKPASEEPCPLVVVFDGPDYMRRANLPAVVDNLVDQGRIEPVALAMVENGGEARFVEYACNDATVGFVLDNVLPLAQQHLRLADATKQPGVHALMGASMGGLISLYTAMRAPQVFGRVLSQSGAFGAEFVIRDLVRLSPVLPLNIWMDIGTFDFLYQDNLHMHALLQECGYRVAYSEYHGGHNYSAWRDDGWRGLEALFGATGGQA